MAFVASCLICWYGGVNLHSKKLLNNIVMVCSKTVGVEQKSLYNIFDHRVEKEAMVIMSEINHVLSMYYCHLVVVVGVSKSNHAHTNHSFHTQSDY